MRYSSVSETMVRGPQVVLYNGALKIIIQFASTYLCEKGFSSLTQIKTKYRNRLVNKLKIIQILIALKY
jgi:hypothetical protein